jgi:hypothetical protein
MLAAASGPVREGKAMAGKGETPQVMVEEVTLGKVWDARACKAVPEWAGKALGKGLGRGVEVVTSKPKKGYILKTTVDMDYDEKKGELSGRVSVIVTDAEKSAKANLPTKGALKGVDAGSLDKKLQKLVEAMAEKCGKDAADEIASLAETK